MNYYAKMQILHCNSSCIIQLKNICNGILIELKIDMSQFGIHHQGESGEALGMW